MCHGLCRLPWHPLPHRLSFSRNAKIPYHAPDTRSVRSCPPPQDARPHHHPTTSCTHASTPTRPSNIICDVPVSLNYVPYVYLLDPRHTARIAASSDTLSAAEGYHIMLILNTLLHYCDGVLVLYCHGRAFIRSSLASPCSRDGDHEQRERIDNMHFVTYRT